MIQIIKHNQQQTVNWSGGTTTQLFIYPADAQYAERNFLFRISTATVETDTSTFTDLTGYQRIIMLLQGELTLTHNKEVTHHLKPLIPHLFDGAWQTEAAGKVTDFNVMFKPDVNAVVEVVVLNAHQSTLIKTNTHLTCLYVTKGQVIINMSQQTLQEKDFMVIDDAETIDIKGIGFAEMILVKLQY